MQLYNNADAVGSQLLPKLQKGQVDLITLHWTVGQYGQTFPDAYHFQIVGAGMVNVDDRAFDAEGNFVPLAHAWHHNSRNIGISLCGMLGAIDTGVGSRDLVNWPIAYGSFPPTTNQLNGMCKLVALLLQHYGLPITAVKTHYDLAEEDGYPGERWEYKYEKPLLIAKIQGMMANA